MNGLFSNLIPFIFLLLFVMRIIGRKKSPGKEKKPGGKNPKPVSDEIYESVDNHRALQRILTDEKEIKPETRHNGPAPDEARELVKHRMVHERANGGCLTGIAGLPPLKQAVVWKEILGEPLGLRDDW